MEKILLFYKYTDITYPEQIKKWQLKLCKQLDLKGRIIIAHEGVNGTLGGSVEALESYKKEMDLHQLFSDIDFKESDGSKEYFPRLRIVVKNEITHLGLDPQKIRAQDGGIHLTPQATHELLKNKPKDLIILDARNEYESRIGAFVDAIKPPIENFRDLPSYIDANLEQFKDKEVLMYCTGGIRCERASAYLKSKNITKNVYQLLGGIHRYAEQFPDGFFKGKNYVFDGRVAVKVTDDILSSCIQCQKPSDDYTNCVNAVCNKQFTVCSTCLSVLKNACSQQCQNLVEEQKVVIRTKSKKIITTQSACNL